MYRNRILKILIAFTIAFGITFGFFIYKLDCDAKANRYYAQGMMLFEKGKYQDAYFNFQQIKKTSSMYPLALLKQFQCADNLQDKKTARLKLATLTKRMQDENIRPYVLYSELMYNLDSGKYTKSQLNSKFLYIQKEYPNSDFAKASAYRIAKNQLEINAQLAKEKFIEYLEYAPNGKYSIDSLDEVLKLKLYFSKKDREIIANAFLLNSKYSQALNILKDTPIEDSWYLLSKAYRGLGNIILEQKTILDGLALDITSVDEKDISQALDRLIAITKSDKATSLSYMLTKYQGKSSEATIAYKLASMSKTLRAVKIYEYIYLKHPNSYWASNSLWEVFWYNYTQQRYNNAIALAKKYIELYPKTEDIARISYWQAKAYLRQKQNSQAKEGFYNVINKYPLSYYSFMSARQLKISRADKIFIKKPIQKFYIDNLNKDLFNQSKEILTLLKYEDYKTIEDLKINNEPVKSWLLNKKEKYPESINVLKDILKDDEIKFSDYRLKLAYPVVYEENINKYSKVNDLSPYLFMSLIREESHFNKNAKSSVGACGLTQLMPATANFIEKSSVLTSQLNDEDENIRIGAKYFAYLLNYFKGDVYLAILSYNAGHGNVSKWLNNPEIHRNYIDEFIENVPFHETKTYIKKILSTYWIYLNIYSSRNI